MEFQQRSLRFESLIGWGLVAVGTGIALVVSALLAPQIDAPFVWAIGPLLGTVPFVFGVLTLLTGGQRVRTYGTGIEVDGEHFLRDDTVAFVSVGSKGVDPFAEAASAGLDGVLLLPVVWFVSKLLGWTCGLQVVLSDPQDDRQVVLFLPSFRHPESLEAELRRLGFTPSPFALAR